MPKLGESSEATNELIVEKMKESLATRKMSEEHTGVALSTMLMALLAAFRALMAGISAQDALLDRTAKVMAASVRESDRLAVEVLKVKHEILVTLGGKPDPLELAQIETYERSATEFAERTSREENKVQALVLPHFVFAIAVTLLSVGIALNGIAVLTKKKFL